MQKIKVFLIKIMLKDSFHSYFDSHWKSPTLYINVIVVSIVGIRAAVKKKK